MSLDFDKDPSSQQKAIWCAEQTRLKKDQVLEDVLEFDSESVAGLRYVGGVDLSFPRGDSENAVACLVVMSMPDCKIIYKNFCHTKLHLPYISGFLAFREVEPLLSLLEQLKRDKPNIYPQVILVDGNGLLHPRKFGIACHLGVLANTPTIGVAKNFLVIPSQLEDMANYKKTFEAALLQRGDEYLLRGINNNFVYGTALRTSDKAKNPVFVSQGHRVTLKTATRVVLATCTQYRLPEPIRAADQESREYIRTHPDFIQSSAMK